MSYSFAEKKKLMIQESNLRIDSTNCNDITLGIRRFYPSEWRIDDIHEIVVDKSKEVYQIINEVQKLYDDIEVTR